MQGVDELIVGAGILPSQGVLLGVLAAASMEVEVESVEVARQ